MATSRAIISVMGTSFAAMAKVSIVSAVGYCCAIFPEVDPLLPVSALRYLSRLSNIIFLPSLIVVSLGSSLNIGLLARIGAFCGIRCQTRFNSFQFICYRNFDALLYFNQFTIVLGRSYDWQTFTRRKFRGWNR
jgi:hypothetical protein